MNNIASASGDYLFDTSGQRYFDLCMGYGSMCLGHGYEPVVAAQLRQLQSFAAPGFVGSDVMEVAKSALASFAGGYSVHGFYPSGANAVEMAVKIAMTLTGRSKVISFAGSMHGKTLFAGKMGAENLLDDRDQVCRIPFPEAHSETSALQACFEAMRTEDVAAVTVEPIQMSGGGGQASPEFYEGLEFLAARFGVMVIYDEILAGCYRTGFPFFYQFAGVRPDIVLAGKALGSGFPVAAVLLKDDRPLPAAFRGGGTFFNHPLACASVISTLQAFAALDVPALTRAIDKIVRAKLPARCLSGMGALWNIDLGSKENAGAAVAELRAQHIVVSYYDRFIRFFPSYRVDLPELEKACHTLNRFL